MANRSGRGFEDLDVYKLSERLADAIWRTVVKLPAIARNTVGEQLIRAADSIGANIAEGSGRGTWRDRHRFLDIARGSFCETRHWLHRAYERELLPDADGRPLQAIVAELGPRLNAYRNWLRQQMRPQPDSSDSKR